MGLGVGWGYRTYWQIGPVPVTVTFTATVGASVSLEATVSFTPENQAYPCIGEQGECIVMSTSEKTFPEAAEACNRTGGRLAEFDEIGEAFHLSTKAAARAKRLGWFDTSEHWIGGQLAYRHPDIKNGQNCETHPETQYCKNNSATQYRWVSNNEPIKGADGKVTQDDLHVANFGAHDMYPTRAAIYYDEDNRQIASARISEEKLYACTYEPIEDTDYLGWTIALNTGVAAGFGVEGCAPNDEIGFCLGASLNIVALSIKYQFDRAVHWMFDGPNGNKLVRRVGSYGFSIPWSLKLFNGSVSATAHFLWVSIEWIIVAYDGITVGKGKLYDTTVPFSEDLENN
jgi:hypothetical protein